METKKNNLRTITQYSSYLRIVLKIQERLVTLRVEYKLFSSLTLDV